MSNLVPNARIKLRARSYSNLGLLILAVCFLTPLIHAEVTEQTRAYVFIAGVLSWLAMQWIANFTLGRLKD
jgi:hypothetical protein